MEFINIFHLYNDNRIPDIYFNAVTMKKMNCLLCLFLTIALLSSCSKREIKVVNDFISASERKPDRQQKRAIESTREFLIKNRTMTGSSPRSLPDHYLTPEELQRITFTIIPYYELDTSFLSSDVDYNRVDQYLRPSKPMYLGKLDDQFVLLLNLQRVGESMWIPAFNLEGKEYFKTAFTWLMPKLKVSGKNEFFILQVFGLKYIVYYSAEGDPIFCNFPGNIRMDKIEFFKHVKNRYNAIKDAQECIKEWNKSGKRNDQNKSPKATPNYSIP